MKNKTKIKICTSLLSLSLLSTALTGCDTSKPTTLNDSYFYANKGQEYNISLTKDGNTKFSIGDKTFSGTYTIEGDKFTLRLDGNETINGTYSMAYLVSNMMELVCNSSKMLSI